MHLRSTVRVVYHFGLLPDFKGRGYPLSPKDRPTDETTVDLESVMGEDTRYDAAFIPVASAELGEADVILISHQDKTLLGRRYPLPPAKVLTIGRSSSADISMPQVQSMSRLHARLRHLGSRVVIEDLGSTNGSYLNDQPVREPRTLASGDRFQVGAAHFKFLQDQDPEHAYHEAIYQLAIRDGLTEIFNKRKFDDELHREFERARRHGRALSLVIFDVDHFKRVNDNYGHLCGDAVLQQLCRLVSKDLRSDELFARVGGEEFAILSPETNLDGAMAMAERLRQSIANGGFNFDGLDIPVTCSFGVAELLEAMEEPAVLFEITDKALYRSKQEGRNRVTAADVTVSG